MPALPLRPFAFAPFVAALFLGAVACGGPPAPVTPAAVSAPAAHTHEGDDDEDDDLWEHGPLQGHAEPVAPTDPDFARANLPAAVKPPGQGGVREGYVVRITADLHVYRLWSGPEKKNKEGRTNRIGGWWTYDAPHGAVTTYRHDYATCAAWNDFTWLATCTLKKGAVVVVGPGQSVSAELCGNPAESYPPSEAIQTYIDKPWARPAELECPPEAADRKVDPADLSR